MDFKKIITQVKGTAEDLKEKAEAKIKETRDSLDKDHNGINERHHIVRCNLRFRLTRHPRRLDR